MRLDFAARLSFAVVVGCANRGAAPPSIPGGGGGGIEGAGDGGGGASQADAGLDARDALTDVAGSGDASVMGEDPTAHLDALKRALTQLQFGIWHHFGILTYTGSWAQANLPIDDFNPGATLDARQWAAAARSAGARFGV